MDDCPHDLIGLDDDNGREVEVCLLCGRRRLTGAPFAPPWQRTEETLAAE